MSRRLSVSLAAAVLVLVWADGRVVAQVEDTVPEVVVTGPTTTTSSLPSAVTTVPEGCPGPPPSYGVFIGRLERTEGTAALFTVVQPRSGAFDATSVGTEVRVSYGTDIRFLDSDTVYIVGIALDPATGAPTSSVRDAPDLFGGAELAGSRETCPEFEQPARTLRLDGTSVDTGVFTGLADTPWMLLAVLAVPPLVVIAALFGIVWWRRGLRR